jgi:hypothetical protein
VLTTINKRAHTNHGDPLKVAIFSAHSKTKKMAGHMDHGLSGYNAKTGKKSTKHKRCDLVTGSDALKEAKVACSNIKNQVSERTTHPVVNIYTCSHLRNHFADVYSQREGQRENQASRATSQTKSISKGSGCAQVQEAQPKRERERERNLLPFSSLRAPRQIDFYCSAHVAAAISRERAAGSKV